MKEKRSKNEGARGCECVIAIEDNWRNGAMKVLAASWPPDAIHRVNINTKHSQLNDGHRVKQWKPNSALTTNLNWRRAIWCRLLLQSQHLNIPSPEATKIKLLFFEYCTSWISYCNCLYVTKITFACGYTTVTCKKPFWLPLFLRITHKDWNVLTRSFRFSFAESLFSVFW